MDETVYYYQYNATEDTVGIVRCDCCEVESSDLNIHGYALMPESGKEMLFTCAVIDEEQIQTNVATIDGKRHTIYSVFTKIEDVNRALDLIRDHIEHMIQIQELQIQKKQREKEKLNDHLFALIGKQIEVKSKYPDGTK